tara:strand:- start:10075 stop:10977 length:903 start_codon:yes stop_codon:yes gene_type:complete
MEYEDNGGADTASEDFRAFLDEEETEWGGVEEGDELLDDVMQEVEEEAPDASTGSNRNEGTDEVLRRLRESDPEAARVVSEMQRTMHRNINEWNDLKSETLSIREQLLAQREAGGMESPQGAEPAAEDQLPDGITPQHIEMFRTMADHLGYIPRSEIAEQETEKEAQSYVQSTQEKAYQQYGEKFGTRDTETGRITVHPEVQARLNQRLADLQDPKRGVTPLDLYRLEFPDEGSAPRRAPVRRPAARSEAPARRPSPNGNVRRSSGRNSPVRIYDPARNDAPEDVWARSWALGKRELSGG